MTTVVPTSEEDPVLSVVRFTAEMSWAEAGPKVAEQQVSSLCLEAQEFMIAGRWLDLASLMITSADLVFSKASDKDLECIFTIICDLVKKPESLEELLEMAKLLSSKIAHQPNDKPALRLKILFNLYNLLENPYGRFCVYKNALKLALEGKVVEHIIPSFKKMDSLLKEWDLAVQDQRDLFLSVSNVLKEHKRNKLLAEQVHEQFMNVRFVYSSPKETLKFLTKYLATFSGEDAHVMEEAKEEAAHTIIEFVKAPDMFQHDLLEMPAVAQLEKDTKYALVYQLLKIFQTQRLDAYLEFHTTNSELLKTYGLVHEECIAKMRLMSIVDLASNESGKIPYSLIKDTLQIEDDEVEPWVVKAITSKLIDCKIDQMNQVIRVSRCTERVFGPRQWLALREKLATWRGNIANVITTIQANKVTEEGTPAMQGLVIS